MKKQEFKNLIKESVKEVLLEGGILSTIIAEVVKGLGTPVVSEQKTTQKAVDNNLMEEQRGAQKQKLLETKKKMLDVIGQSSYGSVDVFEGTQPLRGGSSSERSSLSDVDPSDPGVDISGITRNAAVWKQLLEK